MALGPSTSTGLSRSRLLLGASPSSTCNWACQRVGTRQMSLATMLGSLAKLNKHNTMTKKIQYSLDELQEQAPLIVYIYTHCQAPLISQAPWLVASNADNSLAGTCFQCRQLTCWNLLPMQTTHLMSWLLSYTADGSLKRVHTAIYIIHTQHKAHLAI